MYWESLPNWFWVIYWLSLLMTLGAGLFSVTRKKMKTMSNITILFTLTIPVISLLNGIARPAGTNEFEHLVIHLQQGSMWSIFTVTGYLFLLVWWGLFFIKSKTS